MTRVPWFIVLALGLAACAPKPEGLTETAVARAPQALAPLDPRLVEPCDPPIAVDARKLSNRETLSAWGRDRISLQDCVRRHGRLARIVRDRDAGISSSK